MTIEEIEELIRKYLSTGIAVVVILVAPGTASTGGSPEVITLDPGTSSDTNRDTNSTARTNPPSSSGTSSGTRTGNSGSGSNSGSSNSGSNNSGSNNSGSSSSNSGGSSSNSGGSGSGSDTRPGTTTDTGPTGTGSGTGSGTNSTSNTGTGTKPGSNANTGTDSRSGTTNTAPGNNTDNSGRSGTDNSNTGSGGTSDNNNSDTSSDGRNGTGSTRPRTGTGTATPDNERTGSNTQGTNGNENTINGTNPTSGASGTGSSSGTGSRQSGQSGNTNNNTNNSTGTNGDVGDVGGASTGSNTGRNNDNSSGVGTAAEKYGWGRPNRSDDFTDGAGQWNIYDGPGHAGQGTRSPSAVSVDNGILTITGDSSGTTAGMAWNPGQKYGRWEGRVRAPASDPSYNALLLLWPDAEDFPTGGEIDFMEMMDHTRQRTNLFLHYGEANEQVEGQVEVDATQWHNWALEWTPDAITAYVDGEEWWRTTDTSIFPPGPMHLCIQLDWFPEGDNPQESTMEVDWVRQYSLESNGNTADQENRQDSNQDQPHDEETAPVRNVIRKMFSWR